MATKTTYPPGGTWFDTLRKSFVDVPVNASHDNAIETTAFLEAATSLTTLFGKGANKNDILGNIKVFLSLFLQPAFSTHIG